jgi:hypothetical protein
LVSGDIYEETMHLTRLISVTGLMLGSLIVLFVSGRSAGDSAVAPSSAATRPSENYFDTKVWPILESRCAKCHLNGSRKGGLRLDSRDLILAGGDTGPAAVAHNSGKSLIIDRITTTDSDDLMPKKGPPLPKAEIDVLREWIDRGLPWGKSTTARPSYVPPLLPRRPSVPAPLVSSDSTNPIDLFLAPYLQSHHVSAPEVVDDRLYARRVFLDVLGLLPTPQQLADFEADTSSTKRPHLVSSLLADNQAYAENWMSFWDDALRNDYRGTGYIDGGRTQITGWLYNALSSNMPYDRFVRELVAAAPGAEGFTNGIIWRGAVSASQRRELQAAQGISQVFLGINMKCASCHDSFINDWTLADSYGLASIYSDSGSLDIFRCEKPTGKTATARFIYPQFGTINASDPKPVRMKRLADLITSPDDGRLTRTIVNRLWQRFMGHGLVEPADDMDKEPWDGDLLDFLASDLSDHHYDLKHTIALILTSRAYQLPAIGESDVADTSFVFRGPTVRRMSAEQMRDAVSQVTGIWSSTAATPVFPQSPDNVLLPAARWIWTDAKAATATEAGTVYFRKTIKLVAKPTAAMAIATCDNRFVLYVNGTKAGEGDDWKKPQHLDLGPYLKVGDNVIAVAAINDDIGRPNPAGFILSSTIRVPGHDPELLVTDASWVVSKEPAVEWNNQLVLATTWPPAVVLGDSSIDPWKINAILKTDHASGMKVRAVWLTRDAMMNAMGRPTREQVVTSRITQATMLQALEFTNGPELADILSRGAQLSLESAADPDKIARDVFQRALGREPTPTELEQCRQLLGNPAQRAQVEDLYWSLCMLPEFQLIY